MKTTNQVPSCDERCCRPSRNFFLDDSACTLAKLDRASLIFTFASTPSSKEFIDAYIQGREILNTAVFGSAVLRPTFLPP